MDDSGNVDDAYSSNLAGPSSSFFSKGWLRDVDKAERELFLSQSKEDDNEPKVEILVVSTGSVCKADIA